MKTLKICLVLLCLLSFRAVGLPQFDGANFFMKEIPVGTKHIALVDDEDYLLVSQFYWHADKTPHTVYARTQINGKKVRMHRIILGVTDPKIFVDHKDHDGLNNQRSNIRKATQIQNANNSRAYKNSTSKFKGVSWAKRDKRWRAFIKRGEKQWCLGDFINEVDAAKAFDDAAIKLHGEFACLNFPTI